MRESSLVNEDKSSADTFSLFADPGFTDKDYMRLYPTVYHLRNALMTSEEAFDIRLVYLALHHIIKTRGHFLYDVGEEKTTFADAWSQYRTCFEDVNHIQIHMGDPDAIHRILFEKGFKQKKKKQIFSMLSYEGEDTVIKKSVEAFVGLMIDSKISLSDLFMDESLDKKISVSATENEFAEALDMLDEDGGALLSAAKLLYDTLMLEKITHGDGGISEYKIREYETHKSDVSTLKKYIRECLQNKSLYKKIFVEKKEKNYAAYSGYHKGDREVRCTQEEFCNYLKKQVPRLDGCAEYEDMFARIEEKVFAPKLRTSANGVIPNSLHRQELCSILKRAAGYLPFLSVKDKDGISVEEKIVKIFDYKLPYFIGPLHAASKNAWVVRQEGNSYATVKRKIYI